MNNEVRDFGGADNQSPILPEFDSDTLLDVNKQLLATAEEKLLRLQTEGLPKQGVSGVDSVIEYPFEIQKQIDIWQRDIAHFKSEIVKIEKQKGNIN